MKIRHEGRSPPWLQHRLHRKSNKKALVGALTYHPGCPAKIRVKVNPMTDYDARVYRHHYHHRLLIFIFHHRNNSIHKQTVTYMVYLYYILYQTLYHFCYTQTLWNLIW
ncbi:hypothetical protein Hanom_Chr06g00524431 [Helianthus anomalus]